MRQAGEVIRSDVGFFPDGRPKGNGTAVFVTPEEARAAIGTLARTRAASELTLFQKCSTATTGLAAFSRFARIDSPVRPEAVVVVSAEASAAASEAVSAAVVSEVVSTGRVFEAGSGVVSAAGLAVAVWVWGAVGCTLKLRARREGGTSATTCMRTTTGLKGRVVCRWTARGRVWRPSPPSRTSRSWFAT